MAPEPNTEADSELLMRLAADLESRFVERLGGTEARTSSAIIEADSRQARERKMNQRVIYGGGGSLIGLMSLFAGWSMDRVDEWDQQQKAITQQSLEIEKLESQIGVLRLQQRVLSQDALDAEAAIHDGFIWIGLKIDAISKRAKIHEMPQRTRDLGQRRIDTIFEVSID